MPVAGSVIVRVTAVSIPVPLTVVPAGSLGHVAEVSCHDFGVRSFCACAAPGPPASMSTARPATIRNRFTGTPPRAQPDATQHDGIRGAAGAAEPPVRPAGATTRLTRRP